MRRLWGLLASMLIAGLIAGVPWLLVTIGAVPPVPERIPALADVWAAVTSPDDGTLLMNVLVVLAWAAWASLALTLLVEIAAAVRKVRAPRLRGLGLQQQAARGLVAVAAGLFVALPSVVSALPQAEAVAGSIEAAPMATTAVTAPVSVESADRVEAESASASNTKYRTHEVQPGETLWSIAEALLGTGSRFPEIVELNRGVVQADGRSLQGADWIHPGWTLKVPVADAEPAPEQASSVQHTVAAGDTLWQLAQTYLGDGAQYHQIVDANHGVEQPGGGRLVDPDHLEVGWVLTIPVAASATAQAEPPAADESEEIAEDVVSDDVPADETPTSPEVVDVDTAPDLTVEGDADREVPAEPPSLADEPSLPESDDVAQPPDIGFDPVPQQEVPTPPEVGFDSLAPIEIDRPGAVPAVDGVTDDGLAEDSGFPLRTTGGVGAFLAAGVLAALAARRQMLQRHRRPGAAMPLPEGQTVKVEQELRATADPVTLETTDLALRALAGICAERDLPLPPVRAARVTPEQVELFLAEPAHLPRPWQTTDDPTVWVLAADAFVDLDSESAAAIPAPYPALVTVGHDDEDGLILLDLEFLGALGVHGPPERALPVLAAMTVELATSRWADDLQVTVVGSLPDLGDALPTGRVRYLPTASGILEDLSARVEADREALQREELTDVGQARVRGLAPDTWTPEIVLLTGPITERQRNQLVGLLDALPRVALAAVTSGASVGEWEIRLDEHDTDTALLHPVDLTIRPQRVDDPTYDAILDMMSLDLTARPQRVDDATAPDQVPLAEPVSAVPAPATEPELASASEAEQEEPAAQVEAEPGTQVEAEREPAAQVAAETEPAPASEAEVTAMPRPAPYVTLLGQVEMHHAAGRVEKTKIPRLLEYCAFLATHPGASHHEIDEAIWPDRSGAKDNLNTRNTATSKLRAWLGKSAEGDDYLPRHSRTDGYSLHPAVTTDWSHWQQLVSGPAAEASTDDLEAAVALVRGRPFHGVSPRRYAWAEPLRQEMYRAIVDVCYELGRRRLMGGQWALAEEVLVIGLSIVPAHECLWRLRILAAHETGDVVAEREAIQRMLAVTEKLGGDLEAETIELLAGLKDGQGFDQLMAVAQ